MNASSENLTGGCMCGAVRYEVTGPPKAVFHCHCGSCRSHTGAPVATLAVLTADQVSFSGTARKGYGSAPGVVRAFCPECGTPLTWETDHPHWGLLCSLHRQLCRSRGLGADRPTSGLLFLPLLRKLAVALLFCC